MQERGRPQLQAGVGRGTLVVPMALLVSESRHRVASSHTQARSPVAIVRPNPTNSLPHAGPNTEDARPPTRRPSPPGWLPRRPDGCAAS